MTSNSELRYSRNSEFTNARNNLRADLASEKLVLECIAQLPEDNSRDFARESFQYGVGYAQMASDDQLSRGIFAHDETGELTIASELVRAFFDTLPYNRHLPTEVVAEYEQTVARLVARGYENHPVRPLHPAIDMYQFEAFIAFIEGCRLIARQRLG